MRLIPRRFLLIVLITALLIMLPGGSLGLAATRASLSHPTGATSGAHSLVWYCPAPPVTC